MKVKVKEDANVAIGTDAPVNVKAGTVEVTEKNRAALENLIATGKAEVVKSSTKGDE